METVNPQLPWSPALSFSSSDTVFVGVNDSLPLCAPSQAGMDPEVLRGLGPAGKAQLSLRHS